MTKPPFNHMMLNEDQLADELDAILNYRTSHAGLVLSGGLYFDSSAAGGGDGSSTSPYNTLTALNALSGDQDGLVCYLKKGSVFDAPLYFNAVSDLTVSTYGSGAQPIVSNFTTVSSANWVDYTATQADTYYMTTANWGSARCAVLLEAGGVSYPCYERDSIADCLLGYERASTGATHLFTYFYDSAASRMYIHVDPAVAANVTAVRAMTTKRPRTSSEETVSSGNYAVYFANTDAITVVGIDACGGRSTNVAGSGASNTILYGVNSYMPGNLNGTGQNCYNFLGTSRASKKDGLTMTLCTGHDAMGSNNNGLEISYMSGVTVTECHFYDIRANGVEFWQSNATVTVKKTRFTACDSMGKFFNQDGDNLTNHTGVLFQNCIYQARASYLKKGGSGAGTTTGGVPVSLCASGNHKSYSNVRIINCTAYIDDAPFVEDNRNGSAVGGGDGSFRMRNNVLIAKQTAAYGYASYENGINAPQTTATAATWVADRNVYQMGRDVLQSSIAGTFCDSSLTQMKAAWDGVTGATTNEDNSVQPTAATNLVVTKSTMLSSDLRPYNGSAAMVGLADSTDPDYPLDDIAGVTRTTATCGAYA